MGDEYFWGVTLSNTNKEYKWEPDELKENGDFRKDISLSPKGEHVLLLKQALLTTAPENEVNVIELETLGFKETVKIPIATLIGGKKLHQNLDLTLSDPPVTLRLIEGSGPIYITGSHVINDEPYNDEDEDEEDDLLEETLDEEEDEEDLEEESAGKSAKKEASPPKKGKVDDKASKKRANSTTVQNQAKKKKSTDVA